MDSQTYAVETEADTAVETAVEEQNQRQETVKAFKRVVLKAVLIKAGEYQLSNSIVLPSLDVCLLGEQSSVLVPGANVLAILGVGNEDIKCSKCSYVLAMKIKRCQLQNLAIKCPSCGSVNQL